MPRKKHPSAPEAPSGLLAEFLDYRGVLGRLVGRIVKPHEIDDILQETFIRAYAAAEKTEIRHPRSFMLKTAQNLALNHVATVYNQRTQIEDFAVSNVCPITEPLESELESKEQFLVFCRAVRELPRQCRRVFVLRKVYGLSQREIARYLRISESTVEKHVAKGMLSCRTFLREMGLLSTSTAGRDGAACRKKGNTHA